MLFQNKNLVFYITKHICDDDMVYIESDLLKILVYSICKLLHNASQNQINIMFVSESVNSWKINIDIEYDKNILKDKLIQNILTTMRNVEDFRVYIQDNNKLNIQFESYKNCLDIKIHQICNSDSDGVTH